MYIYVTMYVYVYIAGVFVIGPGEQGILMEHREGEFGDHANITEVMEAVDKMNPPLIPDSKM